jgi:hypothetical protein
MIRATSLNRRVEKKKDRTGSPELGSDYVLRMSASWIDL